MDVRFFEVDSLGVVFNMWYLGWCDEAMSGYLDSLGLRLQPRCVPRGLDAVLRKAELDWVDSLQAFERAEIAVRAEHLGSTSFRLGYEVRRVDGRRSRAARRCATISITYVCTEVAGRTSTPLPSGLRAALAGRIVLRWHGPRGPRPGCPRVRRCG